MNDRKFCFIICTNNSIYEKECLHYINQLVVPDGYEMEIICITDAKSMTSGYNHGMKQCDAKYKIYLHHDVFIVNRNILSDILNLFKRKEIGMIGVIGCRELSEDAIMWKEDRVGMLYSHNVIMSKSCVFPEFEGEFCVVEAIDGLMMITQYDIFWREDTFTKWDFYDISQSREFQKQGYQVVVPKTETPWCIHDDGFLDLKNYYEEREKYLKEYVLMN